MKQQAHALAMVEVLSFIQLSWLMGNGEKLCRIL
jgi:hypothetical protein